MNISKREKIMLLLTLYFLLGFAFYKLWYTPLNQQLAVLKQENIRLSNEKDNLQRISEQTKQRQAKIHKLKAENKLMEQRIPKDKELVLLLEELQIAADKSGVKILSIEYKKGTSQQEETAVNKNPELQQVVNHTQTNLPASGPAKKPFIQVSNSVKSGVRILGLNISAAGRYYQLRNFLMQVEKARRIISVQSCTLQAETKQTETDNAAGAELATASLNSENPPPRPPAAKGERNSGRDTNEAETVKNALISNASSQKAEDRYDMSKMKMELYINTYYCP